MQSPLRFIWPHGHLVSNVTLNITLKDTLGIRKIHLIGIPGARSENTSLDNLVRGTDFAWDGIVGAREVFFRICYIICSSSTCDELAGTLTRGAADCKLGLSAGRVPRQCERIGENRGLRPRGAVA